MWDNLTINGFRFDSAQAYAQAKREAEAIEYIRIKMDIGDPKTAVKVYNKLLEKQALHTVIGLTFLNELRALIVSSGIVREEDLLCINVGGENSVGSIGSYGDEQALEALSEENDVEVPPAVAVPPARAGEPKLRTMLSYYRQRLKKARIAIFVLVLIIIGMFAITLTSDRSPFADAEKEIQDKYAGWAEELSQRERELNEREAALEASGR